MIVWEGLMKSQKLEHRYPVALIQSRVHPKPYTLNRSSVFGPSMYGLAVPENPRRALQLRRPGGSNTTLIS